ncbi:hypothetical protein [Desulfovibrio sp. JC010]|uniref:hypothetical protein n=1 Tax=Desulfovibrio sp. JC010 TaxID=2593641 RepID=UPI0013D58607|nr:hypothetical protein [Desulfovibrio sp. JC010]NDV27120.1 hypothetical protein [Desulfovibrio sp. JC010]
MTKRILKLLILLLTFSMLPSCVKYIPCPDPLPLDIQKHSRKVNGAIRHVIAAYAPEEAQVGNKVEFKYENPKNYRDRVSYGIVFKKKWENIAINSIVKSGAFEKSSDNDLMLEIDIKELYAPEVNDYILYNTVNHDAHVTARYTVKSESNGEIVLSKDYSATATCDKYDSGALWECAANPNIMVALDRAIVKVNNQFISDMLNVKVPVTQQAASTDNKARFLAGTNAISAKYSKHIAEARYSRYYTDNFDRSLALSEFDKMLTLRVVGSGLYMDKAPQGHKIYAVIMDKGFQEETLFGADPYTEITVKYTVLSSKDKKEKVVYRKTITKRIEKTIGDTDNEIPSLRHCFGLTLDEFMKDLHALAKEQPGI